MSQTPSPFLCDDGVAMMKVLSRAVQSSLTAAVAATLVMSYAALRAQRDVPVPYQKEGFVAANGVRLHYVDWGGSGPALLFLTGLGDSAHAFRWLAPAFTDRFHVMGLTRRGQAQSEKPASGYDTRTLAEDIRAFLDVMRIDRASLAGFSVAGDEQTRFAGMYPERVVKLVYLDAANDRASGHRLATDPRTKYPLPLPTFDGPIGEIVKGSQAGDPDYSKITAPALSFFTVYDAPFIPTDADAALREQIVARWNAYGKPFHRQQIDRFRRDVKNGQVIELRDTDHADFMANTPKMLPVIREMRRFLGE